MSDRGSWLVARGSWLVARGSWLERLRPVLGVGAVIASVVLHAGAASAQTSEMRGGKCYYKVPSGAHANAVSGEVWLGTTFLGNFLTDCNATPAVASAVPGAAAATAGAPPPPCGKGGCCHLAQQICGVGLGTCCAGTTCEGNLCCENLGTSCASPSPAFCCSSQCLWSSGTCTNAQSWATTSDVVPYAGNPNLLPWYNLIETTWTVPPKPLDRNQVNQVTLWTGMQSYSGNNVSIIQPELWYTGLTDAWTLECQYGSFAGPFVTWMQVGGTDVQSGDTIVGLLDLKVPGAGGVGDTWGCLALDERSGVNASTGNPSTYPPGIIGMQLSPGEVFTDAFPGVLEHLGLQSCAGLPNTSGDIFNLVYLSQEGVGSTGWSQLTDVRGLGATGIWNQSNPPSCNFNATPLQGGNGTYYDVISWTP